jgi:hypothetical protein
MSCFNPELAFFETEIYRVCSLPFIVQGKHVHGGRALTSGPGKSNARHGESEALVRGERISSLGRRVDLFACRALAPSSQSRAQE